MTSLEPAGLSNGGGWRRAGAVLRKAATGLQALALLADARAAHRRTPSDLVFPGSDPYQEHLGKVEHIVILMMENRSFDHMLGYLRSQGR